MLTPITLNKHKVSAMVCLKHLSIYETNLQGVTVALPGDVIVVDEKLTVIVIKRPDFIKNFGLDLLGKL